MKWATVVTRMAATAGSVAVFCFVVFLPFVSVHSLTPHASASAAARAPQAAPPADSSEECRACHAEVVKGFAQDAHGKAARFLTGTRASTCQSCHGDPAKHLEKPAAGNISNPANLTRSLASESCLVCHAKDQHRTLWRGGAHERGPVGCLSCHSAHHSAAPAALLKARTDEELCFSCHADKRKILHQRSTHLIRTEHRGMKVSCVSCHNPHGGQGTAQLVATSTNDLCYGCHADKRGPFLWEHAPVRENCLTCHTPHASNNPRLLNARVQLLCQQCHINLLPRHQTLAGRATDIWSINRGCANCHSQIHGSNHPSGKTFTR